MTAGRRPIQLWRLASEIRARGTPRGKHTFASAREMSRLKLDGAGMAVVTNMSQERKKFVKKFAIGRNAI